MATRFKKQYAQEGLMDTLTVDVRGFPDEKVKELKRLIECWKQGHRPARHVQEQRADDEIVFATHDSKVNGPITRDEIYADI